MATNSKIKGLSKKKNKLYPKKPSNSIPANNSVFALTTISSLPTVRQKKRLLMLWGIMIAGILIFGLRLYQLQIIKGPELQKQARQQQQVNLRPYIPRRSIIDSNNNVLATDRLVYILDVHPRYFKQTKKEVASLLAGILGNIPAEELSDKFNQRDSGIRIAVNLTEPIAEQIKQLSLDGVDLTPRYVRFYPHEEIAAEVVGYVDTEHRGQAGLELAKEELLEREESSFKIRRSGNGMIMPAEVPDGLVQVEDLRLQISLDLRLQRAARSALQAQMTRYNAKRGAAIVMDVTDGSLLALVCEPTYNPNKYSEYDIELFKNWAVTDIYEPGSTFKPINVAIALDAGIIEPNTTIYDPGKIEVDIWEITNHDYHTEGGNGYLSIAEILQKSSNVGMIKVMSRMDNLNFYLNLQKLGLREKVGVDLPSDTPGYLKSQEEFTALPIEAATASFGQGFSLTALKLLQLHAAIANGGKLVTPHLVKGLVDPARTNFSEAEGRFHWQPTYTTKQVFSPETSRLVLEMMETVVEEGSGKSSHIPGYRIAGKTGTAQKAASWGGYLEGAKITSFVAILPVESPRYAVLVLIDEPRGQFTFGSTVAAPVAKEIMEALISLQGIPPSQ
ncbi:MAG: penicillin-binding protein 2 [Gomphosphaeria aponina SAG 52.96 = DSM 107014]|uniref:Penicillin-binding protein 2 n=1 Tax=Gomphosphaeria aponina SAG 52.96 = DSM 107014 TaxID=1521640 RepID=A0A941GVS7_9CHRO|nr:penicillin-binding protein 2 [Gomphosphaeria aponina SAG 52.96 = DSM 107014]